tara:strand:+ start:510 stop:680 length:171 start_codon:yes stop_codon:yes gene_type:complete
MAFTANGNLVDIKMNQMGLGEKITRIRAKMHKGFLGVDHIVEIVIGENLQRKWQKI